jgi:hypothetical protein
MHRPRLSRGLRASLETRAVLDQFYGDQQPLAAHVADDLVAHQAAQPVDQVGAGRGRAVGEAFALEPGSPPCLPRLLPAGAFAGVGLAPWKSAALSRRTWKAADGVTSTERRQRASKAVTRSSSALRPAAELNRRRLYPLTSIAARPNPLIQPTDRRMLLLTPFIHVP